MCVGLMASLGIPLGGALFFDERVRPLTQSEINFAKRIFGDELDYVVIQIASQPAKSGYYAQAWGNQIRMYYPATCHDYGNDECPLSIKAIFMHELTHTWQNQKKTRRDFFTHYTYDISESARFEQFFREQQGAIIEDYTEQVLQTDQEGCQEEGFWSFLYGDGEALRRLVHQKFPAAKAYCEGHDPAVRLLNPFSSS